MLSATDALKAVITVTPRRLHTAASRTAVWKGSALVETAVAMALGASVHPLTRMTHRVKNTTHCRAGSESWERKEPNETVKWTPPSPQVYGERRRDMSGGGYGMKQIFVIAAFFRHNHNSISRRLLCAFSLLCSGCIACSTHFLQLQLPVPRLSKSANLHTSGVSFRTSRKPRFSMLSASAHCLSLNALSDNARRSGTKSIRSA